VGKRHLKYTYPVKGGRYWRFRHRLLGDVALPGKPGTAAFHAKYAEMLALAERPEKARNDRSFAELVRKYEKSVEFQQLADPTQTDYSRTLRLIEDEIGEFEYRLATRVSLKALRDKYAIDRVRKAHKIKQMLSRLYSWAAENSLVPDGFNPAKGIREIKPKGGVKEIVVWSDSEIEQFCAACPPHVLTPVLIALYTGQRREDVVRMTWQQFQGDMIRVRQSKTHALIDVGCHSVLSRHLEELRPRANGVVICTTVSGRAFTANGLSQALRSVVATIPGFPADRSMHGLRYAAGSKMAEGGCNIAQVEAVLGHRTHRMAMKYASQRERGKSAIERTEKRDVR
jgi:integrase